MSIDFADLSVTIADRKREALRGVMAEVLNCFADEHIPVSEVLQLIGAVIHDRGKEQHGAWLDCALALEKATNHAIIAESVKALEIRLSSCRGRS